MMINVCIDIYIFFKFKPIGGFTDLSHAVSCIDNDHVGEFSNLLACSQNRAYFLGRKTLGWNTTNKTASNKK